MTLQDCLELGRECGLSTLDECVRNVEIHSSSLFKYDDLANELTELYEDIEEQEPEWFYEHYKWNTEEGNTDESSI